MNIEIQTDSTDLLFDLMQRSEVSSGDQITIANQTTLRYIDSDFGKVEGFPEVLRFVLTIGANVAINLVANWLYDKLKTKRAKLNIERTEVQISGEQISRIIQEKISLE